MESIEPKGEFLDSARIPRFDLDGAGPAMHFLHADGYPPACYQPLLRLLQMHYHVFGMTLRPLWRDSKMSDIRDWRPFSSDLIQCLSESGPHPVIAVGHSIGGTVTLRAALRNPERFRAIVLVDPVLFMPARLIAWGLLRALGIADRVHPLVAGARRRRSVFDDRESIFRGYRTRPIFKYMSDEHLRTSIDGMTVPGTGGGFELAFSPEWEAHIYVTGLRDFDIWRDLQKLEVPTLIVRGAETDTFLEDAANLVKKKNSAIRIEALEKATHLVPLERPVEVFNLTHAFLREVL